MAVTIAARLPVMSGVVDDRRRRRLAEHEAASTRRELENAHVDLDLVRRDLERSRELLREHARLWAAAGSEYSELTDAGPLGALLTKDGFSYQLFERNRPSLAWAGQEIGVGEKTAARVQAGIGPVRFESTPTASPPDETIAFATVCTDKFCPGLEMLICGLLEQYPNLRSDFWVFHDAGLTEFSRRRLLDLYPHFQFADRDAGKYVRAAAGDSPNQQRIGALGYLTIEALLLDSYRRVVVLDADLLVVDDISALWADADRPDVRVVGDAGALPVLTMSEETGRVVFNSGVISLPSSSLGPASYQAAIDALPRMDDVTCPVLRDFADQKFWNVHLSDREVTYLPVNLNANKQLLDRFMPAQRGDASIVHYTGAKPWFTFASNDLVSDDERRRSRRDHRQYAFTFARWHESFRRQVGARRRANFVERMGGHLEELRDSAAGRSVVLIGNGPSLARTDMELFSDHVRIGFNWFVNHPDFDDIQLDHLMVMSHMFFGGWHTVDPAFPVGFLEALTSHEHRPTLWFPDYFRPLVESTPELDPYDVRYLLLEKPFKQFVEQIGFLRIDLTDFLSDGRTGVLTAGLPLAMHLGSTEVILVGCDASYGSTAGGDYFYESARHTSKSTATSTLHSAWAEGGAAHACYEAAVREATSRGVLFRDATVDGMLTAVPKVEVTGLRLDP